MQAHAVTPMQPQAAAAATPPLSRRWGLEAPPHQRSAVARQPAVRGDIGLPQWPNMMSDIQQLLNTPHSHDFPIIRWSRSIWLSTCSECRAGFHMSESRAYTSGYTSVCMLGLPAVQSLYCWLQARVPKKHCRRLGTIPTPKRFHGNMLDSASVVCAGAGQARRRPHDECLTSSLRVHALVPPVSSSSSPRWTLVGAPMTGATQRQLAIVGRAPSARRSRRPQRCAAVTPPRHSPQEQLEVLYPAKGTWCEHLACLLILPLHDGELRQPLGCCIVGACVRSMVTLLPCLHCTALH